MALDATLIRAYQNGEVSVGASAATPALPTDATTTLSVLDFTGTGLLTDNGIIETTSQDYQDIFAWQANALVASLPGKYVQSFKFAAMQQSLVNLGLQMPGSTITQTAYGASVIQKTPTRDLRTWVLHGIDGTRLQRIVVPSGQITERGDRVWSSQDVTIYEWTVKCFPDTANSAYAYRYYVDASLAL
jgi:hypothetical protein